MYIDLTFPLNDAYLEVRDAVDSGGTYSLKNSWNANSLLTLDYSEVPVILTDTAKVELQRIYEKARNISREIAFYFIENDDEIVEVVEDSVGTAGGCTWTGSTPAFNMYSRYLTRNEGFKVGMGHTHPRNYGPIFSNVPDATERFGLDYRAQSTHNAIFRSNASNKHMVVSPYLDLMGIFEVGNGRLTYRPWEIKEDEILRIDDDTLEIGDQPEITFLGYEDEPPIVIL